MPRDPQHRQRGFSLIEMLVGMTVTLLAMGGLATFMVQNSRITKTQRMTVQVQADARSCLEIVVARLRNAGWDPRDIGFDGIVLDPDAGDDVSQIEVVADLNGDDDIDDVDEQILIRHIDDRIEWRRTADGVFEVLALNISNDADGDGVPEAMFVADDADAPTRITVQITAQSPAADPSGGSIRYTVASDVLLRGLI